MIRRPRPADLRGITKGTGWAEGFKNQDDAQCDGYAGDPGASAPRCEGYRGHPGNHYIRPLR